MPWLPPNGLVQLPKVKELLSFEVLFPRNFTLIEFRVDDIEKKIDDSDSGNYTKIRDKRPPLGK
jgi:hypothetical protein